MMAITAKLPINIPLNLLDKRLIFTLQSGQLADGAFVLKWMPCSTCSEHRCFPQEEHLVVAVFPQISHFCSSIFHDLSFFQINDDYN